MDNRKIMLYQNIMVIVPHQDDEILMTAGILYEANQRQIPVKVVMATNGDYGCSDYSVGRARLKETIKGLSMLGIKEQDVEFLGYGDTGMPREESFLSRLYEEKDKKKTHPSHCSEVTYGLEEKEEYHMKKWGVHGLYTRENFLLDLSSVIKEQKPEAIFTTSQFDSHGDHSALFLFVQEVLEQMEKEEGGKYKRPVVYSGIVHSLAGDENWPVRSGEIDAFTCPEAFETTGSLLWEERISFPVPQCMSGKNTKENLKHQALTCHVTALKPDAVDFLYAFIKKEELFWKIKTGL